MFQKIKILLIILSCFFQSCHKKNKAYCNIDFRTFTLNDQCITGQDCLITVVEYLNNSHIEFRNNDSLIFRNVIINKENREYYIGEYLTNKKSNKYISICTHEDTSRRYIFVLVNNSYALSFIETYESDSSINVKIPSRLVKFSLELDYRNIDDIVKWDLISKKNMMDCHFQIMYKYVGNLFYYKIIGHYPWKIEPPDYEKKQSCCNTLYLDISFLDSVFLAL